MLEIMSPRQPITEEAMSALLETLGSPWGPALDL